MLEPEALDLFKYAASFCKREEPYSKWLMVLRKKEKKMVKNRTKTCSRTMTPLHRGPRGA